MYRFLQPDFGNDLRQFFQSPLHDALVRDGRLIDSELLSSSEAAAALDTLAPDGVIVLRHPRVAFISYPWEWCPAQWLAAAELTLNLNRELIPHGWILKDATPLNILFRGASPVLVDVASIARLELTEPIWNAYGQFVRTFLLPMVAHTRLGWPLRAALLRRDGLEPEELLPFLPLRTRLRQPVLSAITMPSLLGKTRADASSAAAGTARMAHDPDLVKHVLQATTAKLLKQMRRSMPKVRSSSWSAYTGTATHYSEPDHQAKRAFVRQALTPARPRRVLDVGANAGVYAEIAAEKGAEVVAVDTDHPTLDRLYRGVRDKGKSILPLAVDLANPTPAAGWRNREFLSFLDRAEGHFDALLMLAVVHHLLLHDQIPLAHVAEMAARLTSGTAVIEWVPATDPMFRELVRGRDTLFAGLTEVAFREHFTQWFRICAEHTLSNGRVLFHLERRTEQSQAG